MGLSPGLNRLFPFSQGDRRLQNNKFGRPSSGLGPPACRVSTWPEEWASRTRWWSARWWWQQRRQSTCRKSCVRSWTPRHATNVWSTAVFRNRQRLWVSLGPLFVCVSQRTGPRFTSRGESAVSSGVRADHSIVPSCSVVDLAVDHDPACGPVPKLPAFQIGLGSVRGRRHSAGEKARLAIHALAGADLFVYQSETKDVSSCSNIVSQAATSRARQQRSAPHQLADSSRRGSAGHRPRCRGGQVQRSNQAKVSRPDSIA